jgi:hypothetical protein
VLRLSMILAAGPNTSKAGPGCGRLLSEARVSSPGPMFRCCKPVASNSAGVAAQRTASRADRGEIRDG